MADKFTLTTPEQAPQTTDCVLTEVHVDLLHVSDPNSMVIRASVGLGHPDASQPEGTFVDNSEMVAFDAADIITLLTNAGAEWTVVKREILKIAAEKLGKVGALDT